MAHTPGPWIAGCFVSENSACNCTAILAPIYMGSVASVSVDTGKNIREGGNDSPPLEEARANARLIAAAPELLENLKLAQIWLDCDGRFDMRGINAAIAKAEGRS